MGEKPKNCWEYHNEPNTTRRNCIVFKKQSGDCCFFYNGKRNKGRYAEVKYKNCMNCTWYKKLSNNKLENKLLIK